MKKIIIFLLLLLPLIAAQAPSLPFYYKVDLSYDANADNYLQILSVEVIYSVYPLETETGEFLLVLKDNERTYNEQNFYIPNRVATDSIDPETNEFIEGQIITLEKLNFTVYAPYDEKAISLQVYNGSILVDNEDISRFAKTNNDIFEKGDDTSKRTGNKDSAPSQNSYWLVFVVIIIVLLVIALVIAGRKYLSR